MPSRHKHVLWTGQTSCQDTGGLEIPCQGSGHDAGYRYGLGWPEPRLAPDGGTVSDALTGLIWSRDAGICGRPLTWDEAFGLVARMNDEAALGFADWRLPNRRELRSLLCHQATRPPLPAYHPFKNVFPGWYWSSTTAALNTSYAWYVNMDGGRMFYGAKSEYRLAWPVRGAGSGVLPATGQTLCYDRTGEQIRCPETGQDGELRMGAPLPAPRFALDGDAVKDNLTGLVWLRDADVAGGRLTWQGALDFVRDMNLRDGSGWRLPNINELESLVDCSQHTPALAGGHPFINVRSEYWSSTTSMYEPDWAWALYMTKGAVGVGQKNGAYFHAWPVKDG